ncbi:MAG: PPC domain-containing protein [Planctomycetales bacterium]|nr:PPC domain-containing protein [Planctomycetales bacterium]
MPRTPTLAALVIALASITVAEAGTPRLTRLTPPGGQRGTTVEVFFNGRYLEKPQEVLFYEPGITVESIEALEETDPNANRGQGGGRGDGRNAGPRVRVKLKLADDCPLGPHGLRLRTSNGISDYQRFSVGPFPTVEEAEMSQNRNQIRNDTRETAQSVPVNSTVLGRMNDPTDLDLYRIEVKAGQRVSAEIEAARLGVDRGLPDLHVTILDADGKRLLEADDSALFVQDPIASLVADRDGIYFVQVRHSIYNAANETYRLHVGTFSRPTGLYPAGGQAGTDLTVKVLGDPQGPWNTTVSLPANRSGDFAFVAVDPEINVPAPTPNKLRISPFQNVLESDSNDTPEAIASATAVELPVAFNGIIEQPGDVDCFRFQAKKGDRFKIHCLANAFGSPLDPTIWIKSLNGKSGGPTVRATDSRPNQLGYPPAGGLNRDTLDPVIEFTVPADGEYVLGVEDDRGNGGPDFVYRVECQLDVDTVLTYIPPEPENQFTPQVRQAIAVPAGNRYNTQIAIFNSNRPFNGELEVVAVGLPEGVTMTAPRLTPGMTRVPVVFEAAADTKPQAALIDLIVRPAVDGDKPALASGYRQTIPMNAYGNNDFYLHLIVDKLAFVVTEAAPFSIEVDSPKSALVQNGEMPIKFTIRRTDGFDGPVTVSMEWRPNGVSSATPITVKSGQTEGEYQIGAQRNATAGAYQVTLTAVSGGDRPGYYDNSNRTYVAAQPFKLLVAEPHIEARFNRTSIERGKTAQLVCKLNHLKPFEGKAKATLARLPRGVELVDPVREITSDDKEISFTLRATEECLVGGYQGITLDLTVVEDGQSVRQLSGYGTLRIDSERGVRAAAK